MAANTIGVKKCIIAVNMGFMNVANVQSEDCKTFRKNMRRRKAVSSLTGVRKCTRYQEIEVEYQDMNFKNRDRNIPDGRRRLFNMK